MRGTARQEKTVGRSPFILFFLFPLSERSEDRFLKNGRAQHRDEPPILLVKWYDVTKWLLERVDSFPKNQRFIFGQRIADRTLNILEVLV